VTYQYGLLAMHCCTSFDAFFGISIRIVVVIDNDDPPLFYPSCNHGIKHHINHSEHYITYVKNHVQNQRISFLFCVT
jgi:hypothetical protein